LLLLVLLGYCSVTQKHCVHVQTLINQRLLKDQSFKANLGRAVMPSRRIKFQIWSLMGVMGVSYWELW